MDISLLDRRFIFYDVACITQPIKKTGYTHQYNFLAYGNITGPASLAGILEIELDPSAVVGSYVILTSAGITGTFDSITFTGTTPNYRLSYLPVGAPTYVQIDFLGYLKPPSHFRGVQRQNNFGLESEFYNQLQWTRSSSPQVTGYFLYRNGKKIARLIL